MLDAPLSFWGGVDPGTGSIIDRRHPQCGESIAGHVLAMRGGRGSSSSSTVLAEAIRRRTGPAAIILRELDEIVVLGAFVASILYDRRVPVIQVDDPTFASLRSGQQVIVHAARITTDPAGPETK
jgi:predicted aconitase with swiveling domain